MKSVFQIVLQGVPENMSEEKIKETVASLPEVKGLHDIHVWSMDGNLQHRYPACSRFKHINGRSAWSAKTRIKETLGKMSLQHTTVELETEGYPCAKPEV